MSEYAYAQLGYRWMIWAGEVADFGYAINALVEHSFISIVW